MAAACQLVGPCWLQNESLMAFMTVYACQTHVIAWLLSLWNMEDAHVVQNPPPQTELQGAVQESTAAAHLCSSTGCTPVLSHVPCSAAEQQVCQQD